MQNVLIALSVLLAIPAFCQEHPVFSKQLLEEDFDVFQGSLEDFHPGLYWYRDKAEMDRIFWEGKASLTQPMTERGFYRLLSSVLSKVGCGHTYTSLSEKTLEEEMVAFLPFQLQFVDQKAFFIKSYGDDPESIRPGNQVTSINGVSMDSIYAACMNMLNGDGFTETGKINMLNAHFWYTYAELFEVTEQHNVAYLDANKQLHRMAIDALPKKEMYESYFAKDESEETKRNVVLTIDNALATLTIKSFFGWKEGKKRIKVETKFKEVFRTLEEEDISQLIIDLRDNGGGRVPWVFYAYFVDEPFLFAKNADLIFTKTPSSYPYQKLHPAMKWIKRKWLHTWFPGSSKMSKVDSTRFEMTSLYMTKPYRAKTPKFEGEVYILTNGGSFSAASDVAAMMKSSELAVLIGEESGGGYFGNTSMEKSYVTLPHSKLRLEIPLVRHQLNVDPEKNEFGRGVIPDHEVLPSVEDVVKGMDRQMEWTLDHIRKKSK